METLTKFEVGSAEQDKQIKYMLQKYVAICLNYTDGKLNEVYTDHGNITVIVYKGNEMFTNVYYKVNKITGEKIEFRDFDNVPKMFNARINGFKGKKTMTYDFILMNPPYDKNLHLKILEQSIPMLTDDGILVNLSPIRWLQDPLARYKEHSDWYKFKEVREHIADLYVVPMKDASVMFDTLFNVNLGIYYITSQGGWDGFDVTPLTKKIIDRVMESGGLHPVIYTGQANAVVIKKMTNPNRSTAYNLCSNAIGYKNKNSLENKVQNCIVFDTPEEAENFRKMTETKMYRFCVKTLINNENFVSYYRFFFNAPTYTHPWTDEQLYEYFNLTPEEVNEVKANV